MIETLLSNKPLLSIIAYSLCSGSLLVMNKMLTIFLDPALIACIQFCFAIVMILMFTRLNYLTIDKFTPDLLIAYSKYAVLFTLGVFSNMKALSTANVDTIIVFRSCVPLLVCIADTVWLGRMWPSGRSLGAMGMMVFGAIGYVLNDPSVTSNDDDADDDDADETSYFWVIVYFFAIAAEMVFGKMIKSGISCELSTSVLLTNALTLPAMSLLSIMNNEQLSPLFTISPPVFFLLVASCLVGAGIGFSGWWCRGLLSATSYTIVGVANKFLSILLNIMIWDKHATAGGTVALLVCLAGGTLYVQAPMRVVEGEEEVDVEMLIQKNVNELGSSSSSSPNPNPNPNPKPNKQ